MLLNLQSSMEVKKSFFLPIYQFFNLDIKEHNISQLEPLKEAFEDDPSSDEEGLNMRVIIEDKDKDTTVTSSDETKNTVPTSKK